MDKYEGQDEIENLGSTLSANTNVVFFDPSLRAGLTPSDDELANVEVMQIAHVAFDCVHTFKLDAKNGATVGERWFYREPDPVNRILLVTMREEEFLERLGDCSLDLKRDFGDYRRIEWDLDGVMAKIEVSEKYGGTVQVDIDYAC